MTAQLPSRWKLKKIIETADQIIAEMAKSSSSDEWAFLNDDMGTPSEVKALAEFALAAHEQEPVILYRERNPYNGMVTGWQELTQQEFDFVKENASDNAEFKTLYTRPAPVPAVPENQNTPHFDTIALDTAREIMCDVNRREDFLGGDIQLLSRIQCRIDDACRAAMLNGGKS